MKYKRAPDVVAKIIQGEAVVLDLRSGKYFALNATAAVVFERLGGTAATLDELADALTRCFDVNRTDAEADVASLLAELSEVGLVISSG